MKTKSQFIKNWVKKGGNLKGDVWILLPKNKRQHKIADIKNLQSDEVNIVAQFGSWRDGQIVKISTVAELEQQEASSFGFIRRLKKLKRI